VKNFLWILFFISLGLVLEQVVKRRVLSLYFQVDTGNIGAMNQFSKFKASAVNELPDMIGLCLFFGFSYITFMLFERTESSVAQLTYYAILIIITLIRSVSILSKTFLSPSIEEFRSFPLTPKAAKNIHRLMVSVPGYIISVLMLIVVTDRLGADRKTVLLMVLFFASLLLLFTAITVLFVKDRVRAYLLADDTDDGREHGWGHKKFASV